MASDQNKTGDAALDAGAKGDAEYLAQLGYKQELNRVLGLVSSFGVQFSSIAVGTAMYTTLIVGFMFFGPASFWAYLVGAFFQVFIVGLVVAELVSAYPLSGGVYQINNRITKKPIIGWMSGWFIIIAHTVSVTAISASLVPYIGNWFGLEEMTKSQSLGLTIGLILVVGFINRLGVKITALVNNAGVVAEIVGLVLLIGAFLAIKHPTNTENFFNTGGATETSGIVMGFIMALLLPGYLISSFDSTGNAAEETKNASKNASKGTAYAGIASFFAGAVMFALLVAAIQDVPAIMESGTPAGDIMRAAVGDTVTNIFEILAVVALFATMTILQLTGVRVLWSQARDGQMPAAEWLRKVDKNKVPINTTYLLTGFAVLFAVWSSLLSVLAATAAFAWAAAYTLVVFSGLYGVVKKVLPERPFSLRGFQVPMYLLASIWSLVLLFAIIKSDVVHVGRGAIGLVVAGLVLYALIPSDRRGKIVGVTHAHNELV